MITSFLKCERGATAIEYGLIAALIGMMIVGGLNSFTNALGLLWDENSGKITENLGG